MKFYVLMVLSVLSSNVAFAEDKTKLAQQLMALDGSAAAVQSIKEGMMQQIKQSLPPFIKADFFERLSEELDIKEILEKQKVIYSTTFTEAEMKKAIEFYNTPEGKSIAQKAPKISQEMMFASQQWAQDANERVMLLMQATNK
ncbi:MAG TPA: DUF2059 domain-containing protein [Agitococcus sp.]|jgi:hypothetical protein|nr:DUF2059 domain-containing protein [Pseudomonadales bacterium]MCP5177838.1 DUF2059 domain-containing protein [Moraxellaceae bacterium]HMU87301.1 DUF2059 domain-containing protein [Agitococcus sp.]HMV60996.1 DUF2059 domain-containing protein [Agitococcus sp.]HMY00258.1 DUF2059 domain-containing protein [Agitococcus sp.]